MATVFPRLVVNLKAYPEALGERAVALARACVAAEEAYRVAVAICPQAVDVHACVDAGARVYAQNFDRVERAEATGWLAATALKDAGCQGSILNHSEHRLQLDDVAWFVDHARGLGLRTILCTQDSEESEEYAKFRPDAIAIEPPELIAGDVSVTTADPHIVSRSVAAVRRSSPKTLVLCGAGVKKAADIAKAVELGAHGVLVASGIARAKDPARALRDLASGFGQASRNKR